MSDVIAKTLGIFLAFLLLFVAPASILVVSEISADRRSIVNEVSNFIDEVTDAGTLSEDSLADFYTSVSSYGPIVDVEVMRYVRQVNPDPDPTYVGDVYVTYVAHENIEKWETGDIIKVRVEAIGYTGAERFVMSTLGFCLHEFEFTLAGRVR